MFIGYYETDFLQTVYDYIVTAMRTTSRHSLQRPWPFAHGHRSAGINWQFAYIGNYVVIFDEAKNWRRCYIRGRGASHASFNSFRGGGKGG